MTDLKVNRYTLPDWHTPKAIVLVYPFRMHGREHLIPFYKKFLSFIPTEIKIILLVKDISCEREIRDFCFDSGIENKLDIIVFRNLSDIWIRDYAPIITKDEDFYIPVKFKYAPLYIERKYIKSIKYDDQIGEELGKMLVSEGQRSVYFNWELGNLTHNGAGTAIISNRFIADNETCNIEHELKPILNVFCGFSKIIFIPSEPYDATGHVDGMVRFIDEKVLVVGSYPTGSPNHKFMDILAKNLQEDLGKDYTVLRLENGIPEEYETEGVGSALGNHMNFLRLGNKILIPYFGNEISEEPIERFEKELRLNNLEIEVIPVDLQELKDLARLGGVLNCVSWQMI